MPWNSRRWAAIVVFVLRCSAASAQTTINLKGVSGETACALRDRLNEANCDQPSRRHIVVDRRADDFTPSPSSCTCNTPFFNIWSACALFETRSNTLPLLKDLKTQCQNAGKTYNPATPSSLASIQLPPWSQVGPPTDDSVFDAAGVVIATLPTHWNILQIVAPVASAVFVLCILSLVYFLRLRRKPTLSSSSTPSSSSLPSFEQKRAYFRFLRPSRVKNEEPKGDWVIDKSEDVTQPFNATRRSLSKGSAGSLDLDDSGYAANPFQRRPPPPKPVKIPTSAEVLLIEPPLGSRWSDSEHGPPPLPGSLSNTGTGSGRTKMTTAAASLQNVFKGMPNPFVWARGPARVVPVAPRAGFRLDDYDQATESVVSPRTTRGARGEEEDGDSMYGERASLVQNGNGEDEEDRMERLTLISGEEKKRNDVFLISRDGLNFSISEGGTNVTVRTDSGTSDSGGSHIRVVSPTASTMSFRTALDNLVPRFPPVPALPPQKLPPPPRGPPPRVTLGQSPNRMLYPLAGLPDDPVPLRDLSESENKPGRWEPIPVDQSTGRSAPINLLHPPLRSVYEAERYPSSSSESLVALHNRSHSQSTPGPAPRRALLDDDESFYLTAPESSVNLGGSTMHMRQGSVKTLHRRRSDPQMLFPAAVRSAGYYGLLRDDASDAL